MLTSVRCTLATTRRNDAASPSPCCGVILRVQLAAEEPPPDGGRCNQRLTLSLRTGRVPSLGAGEKVITSGSRAATSVCVG
jgi:hypothetical protein